MVVNIPQPRGQDVKFQLFQNMVMLNIKLNTNTATWLQIFYPQTSTRPHT